MNVVSYNGGKVHTMMPGQDEHPYPLCRGGGMNQNLTKFRTTDAPITCKTCCTYTERRAERVAREAEGEIMTDRNDVTTEAGTNVIEQIDANIERARSLTDAEALAELTEENEALVSSLSGKGSIKIKTDKRAAFTEAANTMPEDVSTEVATKAEAAPVKDYTEYEGVSELVDMGAQRVAEGVRMHIKTSTTAKEIASIVLDMWRRIPNKDGHPDIKGDSAAAKRASSAMGKSIGEMLAKEGMDEFDIDQALKKLNRSVQTQRTDVRAAYLRDLDSDTPEAEEERKRFAGLLATKPDDVPVSEFLAAYYGVGLKGEIEKARERYQAKQAITPGGEAPSEDSDGEPEAENPDDRIRTVVRKVRADIHRAKPEDFEHASDETKEAVRAELEEVYEAIKKMIAATL
jgi:hypothetical protein